MKSTHALRTRLFARTVLAIVALILLSVPALAQETRSTILGTVKDPSGIAGAGVDVANTETNMSSRVERRNR